MLKSKTHKQFLETGSGVSSCNDDGFVANTLECHRAYRENMVKDKAVHKTAPEQVEREADCILETLADNPSLKKLKRAMIQTILLYYGVEQK